MGSPEPLTQTGCGSRPHLALMGSPDADPSSFPWDRIALGFSRGRGWRLQSGNSTPAALPQFLSQQHGSVLTIPVPEGSPSSPAPRRKAKAD